MDTLASPRYISVLRPELCSMDPESIGMRKKTHFVEKPLCISHRPADKEICPPLCFQQNTDVDTKGSMAHPHSQEKSMALGARTQGASNQEIESSAKTCLFPGAILSSEIQVHRSLSR